MSDVDQHKFIFLCGLHRSGTSPLFRILRDHPEISGFRDTAVPEDEGQHLQTVFQPAKVYGGPGRFGFAPEAHLTEESKLINSENRQRLFDEWSKYWDLSKPCLLEKSPPNLIRTRFLQTLFPNSYFVVITRHPVAVSLATRKWSGTSLESLLEHWLQCHQLFEQDNPRLRRVRVIKYEDLIHDTSNHLGQMCDFLGVAAPAQALLDRSGNDGYFSEWRQLKVDKKGRTACHHLVSKYETKLRRYGYSFAECETAVPVSVR